MKPRRKQIGFLESGDAQSGGNTADMFAAEDWGSLDTWDAAFWDALMNWGNADAAAAWADLSQEQNCPPGSICIFQSEPGTTPDWPAYDSTLPTAGPPMPYYPDFSQLPVDLTSGGFDSGGGGNVPALPGYCPAGTYHPQNDPFACVPFPNDPAGKQAAQSQARRQNAQATARQQQMQKPCPTGQGRYPATGQCVPLQCGPDTTRNPATGQCIKTQCHTGFYWNAKTGKCDPQPACPPGKVFNLQTGQCVTPGAGFSFSEIPSWAWLVLALLAGGIVLSGSNSPETYFRRRRAA